MSVRGLICFVVVTLMSVGPACKTKPAASKDTASLDAGAKVVARHASVSAFRKVVDSVGHFELRRIVSSPALGISRDLNAVFVLGEDGSVEALAPLADILGERHGFGWEVGSVAGRWPDAIHVEVATAGGRSEAVIRNYVVDASAENVRTVNLPGHLASASAWSGGRLLGFVAEDASLAGPLDLGREGQFTIVAGPKAKSLARMPKETASLNGELAAYESGHIFARGIARSKSPSGAPEAPSLWDLGSGTAAEKISLPGPADKLVRGRIETETLVLGTRADGDAYLARWGGASFEDVPLPFRAPASDLSIGDDGSVWLIAASSERNVGASTALWRADLPELRFERAALDEDVAPLSVVARNAEDVWLVAKVGAHAKALFHARTAPDKPTELPSSADDLQRQALLKKEPAPYTPECAAPFLILGREGELDEDDIDTFVASMKGWPFDNGVLARVRSGKVWGFDIDPNALPTRTKYSSPGVVRALAVAKRKTAKLVCTKPVIERHRPRD